EALRRGQIAVLLVAGGQGSRLGFDHPKGMFPIGPVSNKSLFQIHAEKVLALRRRYAAPIPFLVMTSPATHAETEAFFREHRFFGLPSDDVHFFRQGTMPALDLATGKLLMEGPGRLFLSPNGHGGTLTALAESGLLSRLRQRGIRQVFYFQVDNPLVKVADPVFLGHHTAANAEVSSKIVPKESPTDKLGNLVLVDGRCSMIEYSDLPEELARRTDQQGRLRIWAGSPAIHIFSTDFLERVTGGREMAGPRLLPFHVARKKVPFVDEQGRRQEPQKENALKFEMFIFDALPLADRWTVVETSRREEFEPLKNATGRDSPETVRQAISNLAADWLERASVTVPRRPDGDAAFPLEISPLHALDAEELASKVNRGLRVQGPTYLE
ncbi:MAG TPA: UDPGP type 1 family protein, partial [Gemmataceae bacterium]|nr:UDPGP type 1 family protein [Gemmataceae bacterium]